MEKKTNIIASNKLFMVLYWLILAGFMLIIFYCSPFSSDDFVFSKYANAPEGFEGNLDHVIMYGNGRLLGNGLSAFLINSRAALALLKTFTFLSITFLLSELLGVRKNFALTSVIYIMVLFPSSGMFAEISNWTAGFNNYCPPIMFILAAAVLLKNIEKHTILKTVLIAVIGFAGQLFSENSSLFAVFMAIAVIIYAFIKKNKKLLTASIVYFIVTSAGLAVILLFAKLVGAKPMEYRSIALSIKSIAETAVKNTTRLLRYIQYCVPLWTTISCCLIYYISKKDDVKLFKANIKYILIGLLIAGPICGFITCSAIDEWITPTFPAKKLLDDAIMIMYFASIIVALFKCLKGKETFKRSCIFFIAAIVSYLPLMVVSPVGHRTFYLTYILLLAGTIILLDDVLKSSAPQCTTALKSISVAASFVILIQLTATAYDMRKAEIQRTDYIYRQIDLYLANQAENEPVFNEDGREIIEITIPFLPHQTLVTVDTESLQSYFNNYIDGKKYELRFIKTTWEQWYTYHVIYKNNN